MAQHNALCPAGHQYRSTGGIGHFNLEDWNRRANHFCMHYCTYALFSQTPKPAMHGHVPAHMPRIPTSRYHRSLSPCPHSALCWLRSEQSVGNRKDTTQSVPFVKIHRSIAKTIPAMLNDTHMQVLTRWVTVYFRHATCISACRQ